LGVTINVGILGNAIVFIDYNCAISTCFLNIVEKTMSSVINYVKKNLIGILGGVVIGTLIGFTVSFNQQMPNVGSIPPGSEEIRIQTLGALCRYQPTNTNYCIKPAIEPGTRCLPISGLVKVGEC
jgi:hypothetical protein